MSFCFFSTDFIGYFGKGTVENMLITQKFWALLCQSKYHRNLQQN